MALIGATWLIEPTVDRVEDTLASESARAAFVAALSEREDDMLVETRGVGHVAVWFTVPGGQTGECGDFPPPRFGSTSLSSAFFASS